MHVEFNSDLLFVASEHAGLHVRSLVPDVPRFQSLVSRSAEVFASLLDFSQFALV